MAPAGPVTKRMQEYTQIIIEFVRQNHWWALPIVFLLAFGESLAFLSLFIPAWALLVAPGPSQHQTSGGGIPAGDLAAFLDDAVGRELYRDLDAITASVTRPGSRAVAVEGGFRLSGRWAFASGCEQSTWVVVNGFVFDGDKPRLGPDGAPEARLCYLPMSACTVLDTWTTTGLRGSGSHDLTVEGAFVPEHLTHKFADSYFGMDPGRATFTAPTYRYPFGIVFAYTLAVVTLGMAEGAREVFLEQMQTRPAIQNNESLVVLKDARRSHPARKFQFGLQHAAVGERIEASVPVPTHNAAAAIGLMQPLNGGAGGKFPAPFNVHDRSSRQKHLTSCRFRRPRFQRAGVSP